MTDNEQTSSGLHSRALAIDHIAIAVPDLEKAITWYSESMGFVVKERRETKGSKTAMVSAVLQAGPITVVLVQGTSPESQVSRYIENYGPGIQHIAFGVKDLPALAEDLKRSGVEFSTNLIQGTGIRQIFTKREPTSGMMYEFIERETPQGHFSDESVRQLFSQLEATDEY